MLYSYDGVEWSTAREWLPFSKREVSWKYREVPLFWRSSLLPPRIVWVCTATSGTVGAFSILFAMLVHDSLLTDVSVQPLSVPVSDGPMDPLFFIKLTRYFPVRIKISSFFSSSKLIDFFCHQDNTKWCCLCSRSENSSSLTQDASGNFAFLSSWNLRKMLFY